MRILVTGATGKLGPHVLTALLRRGQHVRALVRSTERAGVLPPGAEPVIGTFDDTDVLRAELDAADALFLLTPHGPTMADTQNSLIDLAAKSGTRVVKVSGTSAGIRPDGPDACRQHYDTERHLAAAGVPWAVLRPNGFMQTLLVAMAATVRERGMIANPLGGAGISLVDCADVGDAAAAVLTDPALEGRTYVLTGPTAPTYAQIAAAIQAETGTPVSVVDVTPEQAAQAALARGLSDWEAHHLAEMLALFRSGAAQDVTDDLPSLTGRAARSVPDFVREHRDLFAR
jgi:NAD(P)H dehydrogenase (quinone)